MIPNTCTEMIRFSLVIPTISRPTLARTLLSLRGQDWQEGDEVLLVGDGPQPVAEAFWKQLNLPGRYIETPTQLGYWGHGIRNWINDERLATGTHLLNQDDDDVCRPGAIEDIRQALSAAPDRPHIFRMATLHDGRVLWRAKAIEHGNVGTPMIVVPNAAGRLGRWGNFHGGDLAFLTETLSFYPDGPVWREEVIADVWPAAVPRKRLEENHGAD